MKRYLILLIFILLWLSSTYADEIKISQSLNKSDIAFEDSVTLEIILEWDGNQSAYLFNKPLNPSLDRLKVGSFTSSVSSDLSSGQEKTIKKFQFVLIPKLSGLGNIEPITINYLKWPDSIPGELFTEAMAVNIAPQKKIEAKKESNLLWYIIVSSLIISAGVVVFFVKKSKKPVEIVKTAKENLFESLENLKSQASSDYKKYLSGLYGVILEFLNNEYKLEISDFNENDFINKMSNTKLTSEQIETLSRWLSKAQKAKYSPIASAPGDLIRLETEVKDFFERL